MQFCGQQGGFVDVGRFDLLARQTNGVAEIDAAKITPGVAKVLRDRVALKDLMISIREIRTKLEALRSNPITAFLHIQFVDNALNDAHRTIKMAMPWGPCVLCDQRARGCRLCRPEGCKKNLGWLPRLRWKNRNITPDDLKKPDPK